MKTRNGTAISLSYYGCDVAVYSLMQRISHKSRAYIFNAGGLKAFLVQNRTASILISAINNNELEKVMRNQEIDIEKALSKLSA